MRETAFALVALSLLVAPGALRAQTVANNPGGETMPAIAISAAPTARDRGAVRFRAGVSALWIFGEARSSSPSVEAYAFGIGAALDLGAQIGDHAALYVHAEASTLLIFNQAGAYLVAEWTPVPWFSLGSGLGYEGYVSMSLGAPPAGSDCPGTCGVATRTSWAGFSMPLIAAFNIGRNASESAARSVFRFGVEGAAGIEPSSGVVGWHALVTFGYARM